MWSIIWNWIYTNCPIIIVFLAIAVVVWKVAKFYFIRFIPIENQCKNLPCKDNKALLTSLNESKQSIEKELKDNSAIMSQHSDLLRQIQEDLVQLRTYLATKNPKASSVFSVKHSPRQLNKYGKQVYEQINGDVFLTLNKDFFINEIEKTNPLTALDVETKSNEVLIENMNNPIFNDIKNWVYNSPCIKIDTTEGEKDYNVTMIDICFILSIPLRDIYLTTHPELQQ